MRPDPRSASRACSARTASPRLRLSWSVAWAACCGFACGGGTPSSDTDTDTDLGAATDSEPVLEETAPPVWACETDTVETVDVVQVGDTRLTEASGLVASRSHPGVLWSHNDSGDSARVFALDRATGATLAVVTLQGAQAVDWEDLALWDSPEGPRLVVGDVGDNGHSRTNTGLWWFDEPDPALGDQSVSAHWVALSYTDGEQPDVEAVLIDPRSQDLLLVDKRATGRSTVYGASLKDVGGTLDLTPVGAVTFGEPPLDGVGAFVTAGDVAADGGAVVLRTYLRALVWRRLPAQSVAEALSGAPCVQRIEGEPQGEAAALDEGVLWTVSEGSQPTLHSTAWR